MYDISSLSNPKLIATMTIDGDVLDARLVGTQVRVVTVASPDIDVPAPDFTPDGRISQESKDQLRTAVASSTVDDWIPSYVLKDGGGAQVGSGQLVECADLARPDRFSGLDTVAVSSFTMDSALQSRRDGGSDRRRTANLREQHLDVRLDDGMESRRFTGKNERAQVRHRAVRRKHATRDRVTFLGRCSTSTRCLSSTASYGWRPRSLNVEAGSTFAR